MSTNQIRREELAARLGRPSRRPAQPLAVGLVLVGLTAWLILRSDVLRGKLIGQARTVGWRSAAARSGW